MLNGKDFVAVVRISNRENKTLAAEGQTCELVPADALAWLEADGSIKREERPAGRTRAPRAAAAQEGE